MTDPVHRELSDEALDRIAMYVLGDPRLPEVKRFEAHLERCGVCRHEVARLRPVADDLMLSVPDCEPPPELRERILRRIRRERPTFHAAGTRSWIATDVAGIEISPLWSDAEHGRHTLLVRMQPGTAIPAHHHAGPEECYVVEGDLREGPLALTAGDYVRHRAGTEHSASTRGGCLLLVTASQRDERLAADPEAGP